MMTTIVTALITIKPGLASHLNMNMSLLTLNITEAIMTNMDLPNGPTAKKPLKRTLSMRPLSTMRL